MVCFSFLILFLIKLIKSDKEEFPNFLKFPFTTKIRSYCKTELNENYNEANFINDFLNNTIYINVTIGTPQQNIKVMLDQNDCCVSFERDKKIIKYNSEHIYNDNYTQVTPYNKSASSTAKKGYLIYDDDIYEMNDKFYLYQHAETNNINIKNSSTFLKFLYKNFKNEEELVFGKFGLNMNNYEEVLCTQLFTEMNIHNILTRFNYYFDFYSDFHGYFFLGPDPHFYNIESNMYKDNNYIKMNTIRTREGYNNWTVLFNKISIKDKIDGITYYLNNKTVHFDFNLGLIIGTTEYQNFIEQNFFNNLISEKICNKTLVEYSFDGNNTNKYYIFKCSRVLMNGDNFDRKKYHPYLNYFETFPNFEIFHINIEKYFYLTNFDLFRLINGYYYFLIIFEADKQNDIWKFGQTFLKRYQLVFDYYWGTIGTYILEDDSEEKKIDNKTKPEDNKNDPINDNNSSSKVFVYIIIIILFCAFVILAFYLGMKFKESRKKRANELKDDYDYASYENNDESINNNHIINNE